MKKQRDSDILSLPQEVVSECILSRLECASDIVAARGVCKTWRKVLNPPKRLSLCKRGASNEALKACLDLIKPGHLMHLKIDLSIFDSKQELRKCFNEIVFGKAWKHLESVTLSSSGARVRLPCKFVPARKLKNCVLQRLDSIGACVIASLGRLETLEIHDCEGFKHGCTLHPAPFLVSLVITGTQEHRHCRLQTLWLHAPRLEQLEASSVALLHLEGGPICGTWPFSSFTNGTYSLKVTASKDGVQKKSVQVLPVRKCNSTLPIMLPQFSHDLDELTCNLCWMASILRPLPSIWSPECFPALERSKPDFPNLKVLKIYLKGTKMDNTSILSFITSLSNSSPFTTLEIIGSRGKRKQVQLEQMIRTCFPNIHTKFSGGSMVADCFQEANH